MLYLRCVLVEVLRDCLGLPRWARKDAGETTAGVVGQRAVGRGDSLLTAVNGGVEQSCGADRGDLHALVTRLQNQAGVNGLT